jgi:hypothetical protein
MEERVKTKIMEEKLDLTQVELWKIKLKTQKKVQNLKSLV